jgi:hypothetical protein
MPTSEEFNLVYPVPLTVLR